MPTPKCKVKVNGITKDSPLYHAMNMLMSKFHELEERMFGAVVATLPHDPFTSGLAPIASQPQYGRPFHYHYDQNRLVFDNLSKLASSVTEIDGAKLGEVSTILPAATYTPNSVRTS